MSANETLTIAAIAAASSKAPGSLRASQSLQASSQSDTAPGNEKTARPTEDVSIPKASRNPDIWRPADLVLTQHTNALFPHPESQVAKLMKVHSALRVYESFSSTKS